MTFQSVKKVFLAGLIVMSFFLTTILKQLKNNHFFIPPFHKLHINKGFSVFLLTFRDYTFLLYNYTVQYSPKQ